MRSASSRSLHATCPASDCKYKRGRPIATPARTSAPRFSKSVYTLSTSEATGAMRSSHHTTAAHALGSSVTEMQSTNIVIKSNQHGDHIGLQDHGLSEQESVGKAVTPDMDDPTDQSTDPESVLDEEYEENSDEENAAVEDKDPPEEHVPLAFQIPKDTLLAAMLAPLNTRASFWSHNLYRGPNNEQLSIHYCQTPEVADRVAQYFLSEKVVGFDVEWNPRAPPSSIKGNASLIQLACENRIALFHISLFPGFSRQALMPANLKAVLESPDVLKAGVAVKGDFSRLVRYLGIQPQGVFEISRLRNLVEWYAIDPAKVSHRLVKLSAQVLQHLQLPLYKGEQLLDDDAQDTANVRVSDWSQRLNIQQINYAAADAYAGFRLYDVLESKRKQLRPTPPRPQVCDYDAKLPPRPRIPKKPEPEKSSADAVDADTSAIPAVQEQESDQLSEEDGFETAQEELEDGRQLEAPIPKLPSSGSVGINNVEEAPYKAVARTDLSVLKGLDPGYPVLPEMSDDEQSGSLQPDNLKMPPGVVLERRTDSDDSVMPPSSDEDGFEDPELETALQDLDIDSDGTLKVKTDTPVPPTDDTQEGTPQPAPPQIPAEPKHGVTPATNAIDTPQYVFATIWAQNYLTSSIPQPGSAAPSRIRATVPHLRAYHLWRHQGFSLHDVARQLRNPPLPLDTVGSYVLQVITLEGMQYDEKVVREVVSGMSEGLRRGRWKKLAEKVGALG